MYAPIRATTFENTAKTGIVVKQGEDELAVMNMTIGAGIAGEGKVAAGRERSHHEICRARVGDGESLRRTGGAEIDTAKIP